MFLFENVNHLYALITEIVKLRALVKCPICLDTVNNPLQIKCSHIFCANCLNTLINGTSSRITCPLCRKNINRQNTKPNEYIEQLAVFVGKVSEKLKSHFGYDISKLSPEIINHNISECEKFMSKNVITKQQNRLKELSKITTHKENFQYISSNSLKKDAFDLFMKSSPANPSFKKNKIIRTYTRKQKENRNDDLYEKLINFEDDSYRLKIIEWLCDSQNKFDRLTQTQSILDDESETTSTFDFPSISQENKPKIYKKKYTTNFLRRTRSLDVKVKSSKFKWKRHSFSGESEKETDMNIEEIESDKDVLNQEQVDILHILEEKCLNTIDTEILQEKEKHETKKTKKIKRKRKSNENEAIKPGNTGWRRIQNINKTLSKSNREPKKLCVSLSSSTKREKRDTSVLGNNTCIMCNNQKPVVMLEKLNLEVELHKLHEDELGKSKVDNLNNLELHIDNNSKECINPEKDRSCIVIENESPNTFNKNSQFPNVSNNQISKMENKDNYENKVINEDYPTGENNDQDSKNKIDEERGWNFICRTSQGSSKKKQKIQSGSIFSLKSTPKEIDDIFTVSTQKIVSEPHVDIVEKDLKSLFSSQEITENFNHLKKNTDNPTTTKMLEGFTLLNQIEKVVNKLGKSNKGSNINTDIIKSCVIKLKSVFNYLSSLDKVYLNIPEERIKNCFSKTTQTVMCDAKSVALQTDECVSPGFKISSTADFKTLVQHTIGVQTDDICDEIISVASDSSIATRTPSEILLNNNDIANYLRENYNFTESMDNINFDTQAALIQHKNRDEIKTINIDNDVEINNVVLYSKENLKLQKQVKKKLIYPELEPKKSDDDSGIKMVENEAAVILTSKYQENLQDSTTVKNNVYQLKNNKTQNSNISFSLSSDKENKIINKNLKSNSDIKRFKRLRVFNEDSDSDDNLTKRIKTKENPYIVQNLSIEFMSENTEINDEVPKKLKDKSSVSIQESESINYDEYLDKIMRNYNECNTNTSTPKKEKKSVTIKQTKSQDIIDKCNALIKEATVSSPVPPIRKNNFSEYNTPANMFQNEFNLPFNEEIQSKKCLEFEEINDNLQSKVDKKNVMKVLSNEIPLSNMQYLADEFAEELKPLSNKSVNYNKSKQGINILHNLLLQKESVCTETSDLRYSLEEELQKLENDNVDRKSEEVFSDSDVDVIDTTPQKAKPCNMPFTTHSVKVLIPPPPPLPEDSPDVISSVDPLSYLDKTFAPPTAFQDCNNFNINLSSDNIDLTIVPSNIAPQVKEDMDLDMTLTENTVYVNEPINTTKQSKVSDNFLTILPMKNYNHNRSNKHFGKELTNNSNIENVEKTKVNQHNKVNDLPNSLNISPITRDTKDLNPLERAWRSNFSPLEIIITKSQQKKSENICTSTPKQKSILSYMNNSKRNSNQQAVYDSEKSTNLGHFQLEKPCIACTRLTKDQVIAISALTNKKLATYSNSFNSSVTHMIVCVNNKNCIQDHTMKFVSAVASGIWVLAFEWIQECLSQNRIIPEAPYEALDVSGIPGPKIARLTRTRKPLLKNYLIYAAPPFLSTTKGEVENVVKLLGAEIAPTMESLRENRGIRLIITEAKATQDFDIYEAWLETLQVVTVDIEWLSRSVGQYQPLSLKPFALCSDDAINNLGYPKELLVDTPFSFSQSVYSA